MPIVPKKFKNLDLSDLPTSNPGGGKPWLNNGALWVGPATIVTPTITSQPTSTTVAQGSTATFSLTATDATAYQWQIQQSGAGAWSNISGATSSSYSKANTTIADDNTDKFRCVVTGTGASVTSNEVTLTVSASAPPSSIVDYASYDSIQKSGNTVVTADGDAVTRWVGSRAGTILTASGIVAQSASGLLCAKNNTSGYFSLPADFATNRTDFSLFMVMQRPDCFQTRAHFGLGASRTFDASNYGDITNNVSNGSANRYAANTGRASVFVYSIRSNSSGIKIGVNGIESALLSPFTAAAMTGGKLLAFQDGSLPSADRLWAWAIGPYVNDTDYAATIDWCKSVRTPPSETNPTYNIVVFGDSQSSGLNAGGHSWMLDIADSFNARIVPIVGSATYFAAGGAPQTIAANLTQLDLEYRASATRNIIIVGTGNDLDQGSGAGNAYAAAITTKLGSRLGNWQVYVAKQPVRTSPWNGGNGLTSFNTERAAFNSAIVSGGWTGLIDWSDLASGSDGAHWPSDQQTVAKNRVVSALGLT